MTPRLVPSFATGAAWVLLLAASSCYHTVAPVRPAALPVDDKAPVFPQGLRVRLENAYGEPELRRVRSEGLHHLDVDLREWSARLLSELAFELERRGVAVSLAEGDFKGTPVKPLTRVDEAGTVPEPGAVLRVGISAVEPPPTDLSAGPSLSAEIASREADFSRSYATTPASKGFREALLELKGQILADGALRAWLIRYGRPADH